MLRAPQLGLGARQHRVRILKLGRRVRRAAVLAYIAILVLRAAFRTLALDVAIGQEHVLDRIEELLDRLGVDQVRGFEAPVNALRQLDIFRAVRRVPVVETHVETLVVALMRLADAADQLLGTHAFCFRPEHDCRAVRVVGADEMHRMSLHALEAHPDVRLDVLHDVPEVERPIGVGQGRSDKQRAARHAAKTFDAAGES